MIKVNKSIIKKVSLNKEVMRKVFILFLCIGTIIFSANAQIEPKEEEEVEKTKVFKKSNIIAL